MNSIPCTTYNTSHNTHTYISLTLPILLQIPLYKVKLLVLTPQSTHPLHHTPTPTLPLSANHSNTTTTVSKTPLQHYNHCPIAPIYNTTPPTARIANTTPPTARIANSTYCQQHTTTVHSVSNSTYRQQHTTTAPTRYNSTNNTL